jgi:putative inorganic carbon (HCO3(-)) transporter
MRLDQEIKNQSSSIWFLLIGCVFVTLYVDTKSDDPFNTPKLVSLLIVSAWLLGHIIFSKKQQMKDETTYKRIFKLATLFLLALLISTIFTDNRYVGFFGETQRRNGFLQYFSMIIILLFTSKMMNFNYARRVLKTGIIGGLLVSTYGVMQLTDNDFYAWNNPYNSMISTVGNPNFASALLAILTMISFTSLFIKEISTLFKVFALVMISFSLFAIAWSQSRQGFVALFFGLIFYLLAFCYFYSRKIFIYTSLISLFAAILTILGMLQKGPLSWLLYKDSISVRGYYWRTGLEMLRDNPWVGIGVDRYGAFFKEYREPSYPLRYGYNINSSNAHNTFIQFFATSGILVGILYIAITLYILFIGIKALKFISGSNRKIMIGILSTWVVFQAQSFISIDNIGVSIWGWLIGGCILGLASEAFMKKNQRVSFDKNNSTTKMVNFNFSQILTSTFIMIPTIVICTQLTKMEHESSIIRSLANPSLTQNRQIVFDYSNKLFSNSLADPYYKFKSALHAYDMGYKVESTAFINKLLEKDPRNLFYMLGLIEIKKNINDVNGQIELREQITKYDPWNAENLLELLLLHKENGNMDLALDLKVKIESMAPNSEISRKASKELAN